MSDAGQAMSPPAVRLVGEIDHADFVDAVRRLQLDARIVANGEAAELIVLAQSRPGAIGSDVVRQLRREVPLAGVVGLLGSWCEGETRTGRPWPDVTRLYWYEFPPWWHVQLKLRSAGFCPEWARSGDAARFMPNRLGSSRQPSRGVVVLRTHRHETARALAEVFHDWRYATVWHGERPVDLSLRGVLAGVWEGGQLDEREAEDLSGFCGALRRDAAPVVALLDFPRRDSHDRALRCGAASVLGKPWRNGELMAAIEMATAPIAARQAA
jgi:hypothetical protein